MKKHIKHILAFVIGAVALASSFLVYLEYIYMLGFPDGFISELDRAERQLAYVYIVGNVILSSYFIYLGWVAPRKEISKKLFVAIFLYLIFLLSIYFVDYYCRLHFTGSTGG